MNQNERHVYLTLTECYGGDIGKFREKFLEVETTLKAKVVIEHRQSQIMQEYDSNMAKLEEEMALIRKRCKHDVTKYYQDYSGNGDSTTKCCICGAELS